MSSHVTSQQVIENLPEGVIVLDRDLCIIDMNLSACNTFQVSLNDIAGSPVQEVIPNWDSLMGGHDGIENLAEIEVEINARDYRIRISEIQNDVKQVSGYVLFMQDGLKQRKAEVELDKPQSDIHAVLDTLADSYFEADPTGLLTYANLAFVETVVYPSRDAVIGLHFRHFTNRKDIRNWFRNFKIVFETKRPAPPFEVQYLRIEENRIADAYISPILKDGEVIGTRGIIRDISERVRVEKLHKEAREAAELRAEELATVNRISATVSRSLDLREILQLVCVELTSVFDIRNAGIGLLNENKTGLEIVAFHAINPDETGILGMVLPLAGNTSSQDVIMTGKTVVIDDAQNDPRTESVQEISRERGTVAIMIVPLLARGKAIGTIGMPARNPNHVFSENEIAFAETVASQIAAAIDNARLYEKTESALDIVERDLEIGRQIQGGFFPEQLPQFHGWEISAFFEPARQVAGDFYDVFCLKNSNLVAFVIADVCDKGVGAALFMVLFRSLLRAFSNREVDVDNVQEQLLDIINKTNDYISSIHGKSNMFATIFFGILNTENGIMHYVNGGHDPPIIVDKNNQLIQRLMPTGPAVGLFPGMVFEVEQIQFDQGDSLVGFTDGITDAKNREGELFSEERLIKKIILPSISTFSMLFELKCDVLRHIGQYQQFDDITLISLKRKLDSSGDDHRISRQAKIEILGELRDFVEAAARHSGLSADDGFAFKLAAEEICTNIIQYAYEEGNPGTIDLFFSVEDNLAKLSILDDGRHFAPDEAKSPDIEGDWEDREIGGLGIFFVKELMDNISYNRTIEGRNELVMEKNLE